ncbi:hypothetical protein HMPREF9104_03169 [Lentilactobacillus kisonensis F0435]|uniref:Uncharacterized protein n=1 Tax=Lentilactobacillus kisonensis F0435 TaxID=797516 RepID=H1LKL5_9LACO|nr:hypothetical protein HMPREF9104_03169 [Lentilactobacillus kisonensis F0435]
MFEHGAIEVHDAHQNNLKHVDLKKHEVPNYRFCGFVWFW